MYLLEVVKRRQHLTAIVHKPQLHTMVAIHLLNQQMKFIIVLSLETGMLVSVRMQRSTDIAPQQPLHIIVVIHLLNQQVRSIIVLSLETNMRGGVMMKVSTNIVHLQAAVIAKHAILLIVKRKHNIRSEL